MGGTEINKVKNRKLNICVIGYARNRKSEYPHEKLSKTLYIANVLEDVSRFLFCFAFWGNCWVMFGAFSVDFV